MHIARLSESKYSTYKQCPHKYRRQYVEYLESDPGGDDSPLRFGSYIHRIFELGYTATTEEELLKLAKELKPKYKFARSYDKKIEPCIKNFLKFNGPLAETVGTEVEYIIEPEKGIELNGIMDRVIKDANGKYLVIDYKTSKKELSKIQLYKNSQLQGYAWAASIIYGVPVSDVIVAHYYPVTGHFIHCTYSNRQIYAWLKEKIATVWEIRKKKKEDLCPVQNQFCDWCEYQQVCPLFNSAQKIKLEEEKRGKKPKFVRDADSQIIHIPYLEMSTRG